jgi:DNA polymerase III sliding clamp (beta) subunit (PCNA family)
MSNTLERKYLLDTLNKAKAGLSDIEFITQSNTFVFKNGKVTTFNADIAVTMPIKLSVKGAVSAKELLGILAKIKSKEIEISTTQNEFIIRTKPHKSSQEIIEAGIRLDEDIKLPIEDMFEEKEIDFLDWQPLKQEVIDGIDFCKFSASKNENKGVLCSIHLKDNFLQTCDNYRYTHYTFSKKYFKGKSILIPINSAKEIAKYKDIEKYALTENWIHFMLKEGAIVSCRLMHGKFPDVLATNKDNPVEVKFPADTTALLDKATVFVDSSSYDTEAVHIIFGRKTMRIECRGPSGRFEGKTRITYKGTPISFSINPSFLKQIIAHDTEIFLHERIMQFKGKNYEHVVALMKPKEK